MVNTEAIVFQMSSENGNVVMEGYRHVDEQMLGAGTRQEAKDVLC